MRLLIVLATVVLLIVLLTVRLSIEVSTGIHGIVVVKLKVVGAKVVEVVRALLIDILDLVFIFKIE